MIGFKAAIQAQSANVKTGGRKSLAPDTGNGQGPLAPLHRLAAHGAVRSETASSAPVSIAGRADGSSGTPVRTNVTNITTVGTTGNFVNQDVNGLLSGYAWNATTITYSFPTSASFYGSSYSDPAPRNGFQVLTAAQQAVVRYAFSLISQYTSLVFTQITESATKHAAIRLAGSSYPDTSYAYYPYTDDSGGDVFYGNIRNDAPTKAGYAFDTIMHEIGHAVGLKHGQEDDGVHGVLPADHDSTEWSIMDYHAYVGADGYYRNSEGSGNQTYMTGDISALQYLYGANYNTFSSDTVYTWSVTTGQEYINGVGQGASSTNTVYEALWDGGGVDTYDLSNYATDLVVNLSPGEWSTFAAAQLANLDVDAIGAHLPPGNIINANEYNHDARSLIEDAVGGSGDDTLIGNATANDLRGGSGNDVLSGGVGNDRLDGGAGSDQALYRGVRGEYVVTVNTDGTTTVADKVAGRDGTDRLASVEIIAFSGSIVVASGGVQDVKSPTVALNTEIMSGGRQTVHAGGVASATTVDHGGAQFVTSGGITRASRLLRGSEYVSSGGVASGTRVSSGGAEKVTAGGIARSSTVLSGGSLVVSGGGVASATVVSAGGRETVTSGSIDRLSVISSGGMAFIGSAATVSGTRVLSGATLTVSAGGVVRAGLTLSGGTAAVSGAMAAGQQVGFDGSGGTLALYNLSGFAAVLSGFSAGDRIDLGGFAYGAGETRSFVSAASHASGTLTVVDGAKTAKLTLLGSYVTSNFALSDDGAGGTFVKFV